MSAAPPASAITPALIEAAKKEGKVVWYTSVDLPLAEKIAKAFEAKYPGIAVRVERTGAERVFQRIGQEYASNIHAVDVVNSSDAAHFDRLEEATACWKPYVPEDVAKFYPAEHKDPDGMFASFRVWVSHHRLQHQSGEKGRSAEELCRSARSEMEGQDRQGASRLQRHDHDRDLPDAARSRLGLLREACRAEHHAGAVVGRSAEAPGARRARGDGRRQRVQHLPDQREGRPGRAGLCHRRLAADRRPDRHVQGGAQSERRASCSQPTASRRSASSSSSMSAACARCIRRPRKSPAARRSRTSR